VIAKVPDTPTQDESPEEERAREEQEIYLEAINSQREESVFEILEAMEDGGPDAVKELSDNEQAPGPLLRLLTSDRCCCHFVLCLRALR
jgi:hypothetical protein